jgi:hypothetical protein
MAVMQNQNGGRTMQSRWAGEVRPPVMEPDSTWSADQMEGRSGMPMMRQEMQIARNGQMTSNGLDMQNNLPAEVVENPTTSNQAYLGSLRAMLNRNKGNFIVATFLIGTQNTIAFEGILYDVGNDYVTIYQQGRDRYIVSDIYSLKYMEFYDTRRREMCDAILRRDGIDF